MTFVVRANEVYIDQRLGFFGQTSRSFSMGALHNRPVSMSVVLDLNSSGPAGLKCTNRELLAGIVSCETRAAASSRTMNISASIATTFV